MEFKSSTIFCITYTSTYKHDNGIIILYYDCTWCYALIGWLFVLKIHVVTLMTMERERPWPRTTVRITTLGTIHSARTDRDVDMGKHTRNDRTGRELL